MITDPRFGRLQEGHSENPLLTTHLGRRVLGLQNGAMPLEYLGNESVASLGKHYAAYGTLKALMGVQPLSRSGQCMKYSCGRGNAWPLAYELRCLHTTRT